MHNIDPLLNRTGLPTLADAADSSVAQRVTVTRVNTFEQLEPEEWDQFVPRDLPHIRFGFLKAAEQSKLTPDPHYLRAWSDRRLVGVAFVYGMPIDILTLAPKKYIGWLRTLRNRLAPKLLYLTGITCGPIITNCSTNFHIATDLSAQEQTEVMGALLDEMERISAGNLTALFEFSQEAVDMCGPALESRGYIRGHSLPGTRMEVKWRSIDEYVALMRRTFRRTVLKDQKAAEGLEFAVINDFSEIAEEACELYCNVLAKAEIIFEALTPAFFKELAAFEQSRLVTARDRATGKLVGIELLLAGDTVLQDLYTGLDYGCDPKHRLYFNLIYPVIALAGEGGFARLSMGQTAYTFKARLGLTPYPLFVYVKHRNRAVHWLISKLKGMLFPAGKPITYKVFRDEPTADRAESPPMSRSEPA